MHIRQNAASLNRRDFVSKAAGLAGAVTFVPSVAAEATPSRDRSEIRLVQNQPASPRMAPSPSLEVKSVPRLVGSTTKYAYAVKAGPWIFLNGHEAFDFQNGIPAEVTGPTAFPLFGRPRSRREGDFILGRMRRILRELGSDLSHGVRLDQYYPSPRAVAAYHL